MLKAKLVIVGGDAKAGEVNLQLPTIIGRGKEADLTIPHALVSRAHSELFERDGLLFVKDLGSLNGTFVNNTRIESEQVIEPNQLLTLGNITFRAVYNIDQSAQATMLSTSLPDDFHTISFEPSMIGPSDSKPTLSADITAAADNDAPRGKDGSDPDPVFEETKPPRSAISEIDSFDPDEVGSLGIGSELGIASKKINPQVINSQVRSPQKPSSKQTIATPAQRNPPISAAKSPPIKSPPQKKRTVSRSPRVDAQPTPIADAPIDSALANLSGQAPVAQISAVNVDLGLPDDATPVSFVGEIQTDDNDDTASQIDDFQIDLGSQEHPESNVDASRLGSFLKKLPK